MVDYLQEQLVERQLTEEQKVIAGYVVGNIDTNGYL
ncbi:MAG: hypothetical protein K2J74_06605, partial [Muribaculaceae bacterium]|nr:hypothetical protein [Muribaculaceae bacterium]